MLSGAKAAMPAEPFAMMLASFKPHLEPADWTDLTTRLGVSA
jgi:hypothetical protein